MEIPMKRILYLFSHTSIQLRFVSLLSSSILFVLGFLLDFFSRAGLLMGVALGFVSGALFWYETKETLYKDGQFPVTATQKFSYGVLFLLYAMFLGCLVERFQRFPSPGWTTEILGAGLYGTLGFLVTYTLAQLVRLSYYLFQGGVLDRFIWKERRTGKEGMIGRTGVVTDRLCPGGKIFVHGEIWSAEATGTDIIENGTKVLVERMSGLVLYVRPLFRIQGSAEQWASHGSVSDNAETVEVSYKKRESE
jgi:membrane protein implicated in regulation of membrane protease activity